MIIRVDAYRGHVFPVECRLRIMFNQNSHHAYGRARITRGSFHWSDRGGWAE